MRPTYNPYYYYYYPYHRYYDYYRPYPYYDHYWPYRPYYNDYYLYDSNVANVDQAITNFGDMQDVYQNSYINQIG